MFGNKLQTGILISFKYLSSALMFPFHLSFLIEQKGEFPSAGELNEYLIAGRVDPAACGRIKMRFAAISILAFPWFN